MAANPAPPRRLSALPDRLAEPFPARAEAAPPGAALRRIDWRFLLPLPGGAFRRLVLLGGPAGLAAAIQAAGLAKEVSPELPEAGQADVVAVLRGVRVSLPDAAACLPPGGRLYYEVDRRLPENRFLSPGRFHRRLRRAGLNPTGLFWAAPSFENCKRYIPLDSPEAFAWYLSTLFVAGGALFRLIEAGLQVFARGRIRRFAALAPCYAVTACAGPADSAPPSVLSSLALPPGIIPPGVRPLVLTSGQDDGSRAVVLPFVPGRPGPAAVFKISTLPAFNANVEREQAALAEIRGVLEEPLRRSLPAPLGLFHYGGLAVGIESPAAGRPLSVSSGRWPASPARQVSDLRAAACWLAEFNRQAQIVRLPWDGEAVENWLAEPLAAFTRTFGASPAEERFFDGVIQFARSMNGASLPLVRLHYDFGPWNLYRAAEDLTVIDWEFGGSWERRPYGPALYDLLFFAVHWLHVVQRLNTPQAELQGFYRNFIVPGPPDRYARAARQAIAVYLQEIEMDPRFLPLVQVYLWAEQSLRRSARSRILAHGRAALPGPGELRQNIPHVRYIELLAEHSGDVFAQVQRIEG